MLLFQFCALSFALLSYLTIFNTKDSLHVRLQEYLNRTSYTCTYNSKHWVLKQHCVTNAISVNSAADKSDRHCFGSCKITLQLSHYYTVRNVEQNTTMHNDILYYIILSYHILCCTTIYYIHNAIIWYTMLHNDILYT